MRERKSKITLVVLAAALAYWIVFPVLTPDDCVAYRPVGDGEVEPTACTASQKVEVHFASVMSRFGGG